jgi:uncharacterized protein YbjT (DUF2867 family)
LQEGSVCGLFTAGTSFLLRRRRKENVHIAHLQDQEQLEVYFMKRVLVTGGTGTLGRNVVPELLKADYTVRIMSRQPKDTSQWPNVEWVQGDLTTGNGVREAVVGVDAIIHAASNAGVTYGNVTMSAFLRKALLKHDGSVDVNGTKLLLEQARAADVAHCIYVSIVGIEHIPFAYYRHKLEAEALVRDSGVPWSIARATQFHSLIDTLLLVSDKWPILTLATDFQLQPVDARDVARYLCSCVQQDPGGQLPDFGGPEIMKLGDVARTWLDTRKEHKRIMKMPLPGKTAREVRQGKLTCPANKSGTITWSEWVRETYAQPLAARAGIKL